MRPITHFLLLAGPGGGGATSVTVILDAAGAEIVDPLDAELVDNTLDAELADVILDAEIPTPLDAEIT